MFLNINYFYLYYNDKSYCFLEYFFLINNFLNRVFRCIDNNFKDIIFNNYKF